MPKPKLRELESEETQKPILNRCDTGNLGCKGLFPAEQYSFGAGLCKGCLQKIAYEYGLDYQDAGIVATALLNQAWYFDRYQEAKDFDLRKRVRILILAAGVRIRDPQEHETKWADFLQQEFPFLGSVEKTRAAFRSSQMRKEVFA